MNTTTRRNFLRALLSIFAVGGMLGLSPKLVAQSPTEEVSGRLLKEDIEAHTNWYILNLEAQTGRKLTRAERDGLIQRLWTVAKDGLEQDNAYVVMDP